MTSQETEVAISKQPIPRRRRLKDLFQDGAELANEGRVSNDCAVCTRTGRVLTYRKRDGSETFLGERCASYLEYLRNYPQTVQPLLG